MLEGCSNLLLLLSESEGHGLLKTKNSWPHIYRQTVMESHHIDHYINENHSSDCLSQRERVACNPFSKVFDNIKWEAFSLPPMDSLVWTISVDNLNQKHRNVNYLLMI